MAARRKSAARLLSAQERADSDAVRDRTEAAVAQTITEMLLVDAPLPLRFPGASRLPGIKQIRNWAKSLTRAQLINKLKPVLTPFVIGELSRMGRVAPGADASTAVIDTSGYGSMADEVVEKAIDDFLDIAPRVIDKVESSPPDVKKTTAENSAAAAARVLVTNILNAAQQDTADGFGFTHKTWRTRLDDRVRSSHALLEGKTVPVAQPFAVGPSQALMMHPGDKSGPLDEWINCRCRLEMM